MRAIQSYFDDTLALVGSAVVFAAAGIADLVSVCDEGRPQHAAHLWLVVNDQYSPEAHRPTHGGHRFSIRQVPP